MSEKTLLLEVMRKEFQQVTGVVLVIVMDVGEEVVQPLLLKTDDIHPPKRGYPFTFHALYPRGSREIKLEKSGYAVTPLKLNEMPKTN